MNTKSLIYAMLICISFLAETAAANQLGDRQGTNVTSANARTSGPANATLARRGPHRK
jgi:hypothetical protein